MRPRSTGTGDDADGLTGLRRRGEELHRALCRDRYEARAGLASGTSVAAIFERFSSIPTHTTFAALQKERAAAVLPEQRAAIGRLAEWVATCIEEAAGRDLADRLAATEAELWSVVRGERIGVHELLGRVTNATDRALRAELYEAFEGCWRALAPLCADILSRGRDAVRDLGLGEYVPAKTALAGFDLVALARASESFLRRTDDLYRDALAELVRRVPLGAPRRELALHDLWALFRLRERDGIFPAADLRHRCLGTVERMGLDPLAAGRIRFDLEDRPAKNPRAFCVGLRVPDEVVVVCKPRGGADDWCTFMHEVGHALHRAATSSSLPFEDRALGDASVTEGWATTLERIAGNRLFLERVLGLPRARSEIPTRELATRDLFIARRHAAKLSLELALADDVAGGPERYADALSRASGVSIGDARWAVDIDPGFYSARYLRAWQLEAVAFECLRDRFDEDWFVNPRTGPFLQTLWALGQSRDAEQIATDAFGATLDMERLVGRFEARLG
jgi:hypothetical protein